MPAHFIVSVNSRGERLAVDPGGRRSALMGGPAAQLRKGWQQGYFFEVVRPLVILISLS